MADLLALLCLGAFSFVALANVLYGLPHLIAVTVLRPIATGVIFVINSALAVAVYSAVSGSASLLASAAVLVALLPYPTYWLVSLWAWLKTDEEGRVGSLRIRREISDRYEEAVPQGKQWYPAVVYDLERLRRRCIYEAPATS